VRDATAKAAPRMHVRQITENVRRRNRKFAKMAQDLFGLHINGLSRVFHQTG
jgi:hypothetical protein